MKEQDQTVWMNGEGAWGGRSGPDSNYTKVVEEWRKKFLTWDQEAICRKLHINTYDENEILLRYFGVLHRIRPKNREITCPENRNIVRALMNPWHFIITFIIPEREQSIPENG